jgi:pyruvate/2-oxoglutarate dehydrogenase complex dihydrolipoamide acyltransferase (E2) component
MQIPLIFTTTDLDAGQPVVSMWLASIGEIVEAGEPVVEVLYPGVTTSVIAPCAGRLVAIQKPIDAQLTAGDTLGLIESNDSPSATA